MKVIDRFSVEPSQQGSNAARHLEQQTGRVQLLDQVPAAADLRDGKRRLHIVDKRGDALDLCASQSEQYVCCNVRVLRALSNCPFDCSYCFLGSYLTDNTTRVVGNIAALVDEVRAASSREPHRFLRIGTWELGDSLALERLTGTAAELVLAFAELPHAILELRSKGDDVESLLALPHNGRTVLGWTLNPKQVVQDEELRTASVAQRIAAMGRAVEAGYPVSLHFDPMVFYDDWSAGYRELVEDVARVVPAERIAWISIGSLRFKPEMKKGIEERTPRSRITAQEMVLGDDGKMRYPKPLRLRMYRQLVDDLRHALGDGPYLYLCMERWDVWERIFGSAPGSSDELEFSINRSLYHRFPGLLPQQPLREHYVRC